VVIQHHQFKTNTICNRQTLLIDIFDADPKTFGSSISFINKDSEYFTPSVLA